jgi:hypothetical protein
VFKVEKMNHLKDSVVVDSYVTDDHRYVPFVIVTIIALQINKRDEKSDLIGYIFTLE